MRRSFRCLTTLLGLCLALSALAPALASAAVPQTMSYQGYLSNGGGGPLADGAHALDFALYTSDAGGAPIWSESQPAVDVAQGYFSVTLGSVTPLDLPFDQPYWLEVSVDGGAALAPRIALAASPYALSVKTPLPPGTLYSNSLINGPGIAQNSASSGTIGGAGNATYANALSVTITTPGPGYILVSAHTTLVVLCNTYVGMQITETSNGPLDSNHLVLGGGQASTGLTSDGYIPASFQRTYFKNAGTYTFYLQGRNAFFTSCIPYMYNPVLTALYVPTSYGAVVTAAEGAPSATAGPAVVPGETPPAPLAPSELVVLRDLELRALRSQAAAEKAERELEQARAKAARTQARTPARSGGGK
jgi:hypothetical protein